MATPWIAALTLGVIKPEPAADHAKLKDATIPGDIRFEQGLEVLGLSQYAARAAASAPAWTSLAE